MLTALSAPVSAVLCAQLEFEKLEEEKQALVVMKVTAGTDDRYTDSSAASQYVVLSNRLD
jgi:hypothetical protein